MTTTTNTKLFTTSTDPLPPPPPQSSNPTPPSSSHTAPQSSVPRRPTTTPPPLPHNPSNNLTTTVYIETSLDPDKITQSLQTLQPAPPLTPLQPAQNPQNAHLYVLEIPKESYLSLQSILHHQFGTTKVKFYTSRDVEMFYEGKLSSLYVENVHDAFEEDDVRMLFEPLGEITHVKVYEEDLDGAVPGKQQNPPDAQSAQQRRRWAMVTYAREEDAKRALLKINNLSLGCGVKMHVGLWNDHLAAYVTEYLDTYQKLTYDEQKKHYLKIQKTRMTQLGHGGQGGTMGGMRRDKAQMGNRTNRPTPNMLLLHMFDPAVEQGNEGWEDEIIATVREKAMKFGQVEDAYLLPDNKGRVYVRFNDKSAAQQAVQNLNRIWFGDRQIIAKFVDDAEWYQKRVY